MMVYSLLQIETDEEAIAYWLKTRRREGSAEARMDPEEELLILSFMIS
jgi:hypothetical protein